MTWNNEVLTLGISQGMPASEPLCTGAQISFQHILTAAHCFFNEDTVNRVCKREALFPKFLLIATRHCCFPTQMSLITVLWDHWSRNTGSTTLRLFSGAGVPIWTAGLLNHFTLLSTSVINDGFPGTLLWEYPNLSVIHEDFQITLHPL